MDANQPRATPSYGYDGTYASFQVTDPLFCGYDAAADGTALNLDASAGDEAKSCHPDAICLENGRILLPKSTFERAKRHLDWIEGKRSSPH